MVEELAAVDAYVRRAAAVVLDVRPEGVLLDRTPFYARGGGQPGDTGTLRWTDRELAVTDTVRREGAPVHVVAGDPPPPGTEIEAEIDWDRRLLLMRTHTALHALSGIVWRDFGAKVTGGNMEPGAARMDFELEGITAEFGRDVEERLNRELAEGHRVDIRFAPRTEALAHPDLIRTKVNLIPEHVDPIRVVEIVGLDRQADGGTHVRSTAEVGAVRVTKTDNKGRGLKRMRIALADAAAAS